MNGTAFHNGVILCSNDKLHIPFLFTFGSFSLCQPFTVHLSLNFITVFTILILVHDEHIWHISKFEKRRKCIAMSEICVCKVASPYVSGIYEQSESISYH